MDLKYLYFILLCISLLYVYYKLELEKRYRWHTWDDSCLDEKGVRCSKLVYSDNQVEGLLVEYFYNIQMTTHLAERHIQSKNRSYRRSRGLRIFTKI